MESMPNCQEHQRQELAQISVTQKFEPFVNILPNPLIRIYVKGVNIITKLSSVFEQEYSNIFTTVPTRYFVFVFSVVG